MVQDIQIGGYEPQMRKEKIEIAKCCVSIFFDSILFRKKAAIIIHPIITRFYFIER